MLKRILYSTLVKILVGAAACILVTALAQTLVHKLLILPEPFSIVVSLVSAILSIGLSLTAYIFIYRRYEKRSITELAAKDINRYIAAGSIVGTALQAMVILVIYLAHSYSVLGSQPPYTTLPVFIVSANAAVIEELVFRGIIFRLTEQRLGSYFALLISAVLFGALHLANEHSSLLAGTAIAVEAGVLLGVAYMYTRSLWFPIGIHLAWNYAQSGIFGASTSGHPVEHSVLTSHIQGNTLITGGAFGPEASLQAIVFCLAAAVILFIACIRQHKIILPHWKTHRTV